MYLLNGESKHCIGFTDRGFQYGDGLFETIEVSNGKPVFLNQHLQRLFNSCKKLLIPPPDIDILRQEAMQVARHSNSPTAVLKLIVTRGSGGRGYRQPETINATRLFSLHPFPDYPESFKQKGIKVRFCQTRLGINPALAGIKHMNRLEQIMARAEWDSTDIQEGLMLDINNNVIEGTMTNVFAVKNNSLITPEISQCGVNGILRNIVLNLAKNNKIKVREKALSQESLLFADEVFVTNSIIGLWPVNQIEQQMYQVGPLTSKLQSEFLAFRQKESDAC